MRLNASIMTSLMLFCAIYGSKAFGQGRQSYAQEIATLRQELDSLKHAVNSIILQQRITQLEAQITKIQTDVTSPEKLEGDLRKSLIVDIALYYGALSAPIAIIVTIIIGWLGYNALESIFFRYLEKENYVGKLIDKLIEKQDFLDRLTKTAVPHIAETALPPVQAEFKSIVSDVQKRADSSITELGKYWTRLIEQRVKDLLTDAEAKLLHKLPTDQLEYHPVNDQIAVSIKFGDITKLQDFHDIIVSSDDTLLRMAGGVAKKIRDAGGDEIFKQAKSRKLPIELADVAVTSAGKLNARYVFHPAVIDINEQKYPDEQIIRAAVQNCFKRVEELKEPVQSIAFPILGAGTGGLDLDQSAEYIARQVLECLQSHDIIKKVTIVIFNPNELKQKADELFGNIFGDPKSKSVLPKA